MMVMVDARTATSIKGTQLFAIMFAGNHQLNKFEILSPLIVQFNDAGNGESFNENISIAILGKLT